jgi:pSer/pThr/pTyr-binding forkhead associated (FHA) protein
MLVLKVLGESPKEIRVPQETFTVGRSTECDYRLEDSRISRKHARFSQHEMGGWLVEDLGSTHKTRVNGAIIESPTRLEAGDLVQMGSFAVEIELPSSEVPSPAEAEHAQGAIGSTASITYPAEELRTRWLQSPPKNEIWQRLHRVHVNPRFDRLCFGTCTASIAWHYWWM